MRNQSWASHFWIDTTKKYHVVALAIIYNAFTLFQSELCEQEYLGDFLANKFIELGEGKQRFGQPDVTLEDSKLMNYEV